MTGDAQGEHGHVGGSDDGAGEQLSGQGVGMGMSEEGTTFEPEETPEVVDEAPGQGGGADETGLDGPVEPRDLVPDEDRVDEVEMPHEVLPDDERDVHDDAEQEEERLLPDDERPVPGGPADD